jgi:hypothetical protein
MVGRVNYKTTAPILYLIFKKGPGRFRYELVHPFGVDLQTQILLDLRGKAQLSQYGALRSM